MSESTARFLKRHETEVSIALTNVGSDFIFSVDGHSTRQRNNFKLWRKSGLDVQKFKENVHTSFKTINCKKRSMVCVREQSRTKLALCSYAFPVFNQLRLKGELVHFVTIVQPQHYTDIGQLNQARARRVLRKFDDVMRGLKKIYYNAVGFAAIEIIAYEDREGGVQFHPHVHAVVAGVPYEELQKVFEPRKSSKQRPGAKPVVVKKLTDEHDIAHRLLYMMKFKAHLSYPHESLYLNGSRSDRDMPRKLKAEWLLWMSAVSISEIICFSGFSRARVNKIYNVEMETIINRFLSTTNHMDNRGS